MPNSPVLVQDREAFSLGTFWFHNTAVREGTLIACNTSSIDLNIIHFESKKRNKYDNRRMLSVNELIYIKTLQPYKTRITVGVG